MLQDRIASPNEYDVFKNARELAVTLLIVNVQGLPPFGEMRRCDAKKAHRMGLVVLAHAARHGEDQFVF
jgi:hypothetical protein